KKSRGWLFIGLVIGLLGLQVVLCGAGIYVANSSKSFAVESDYYSKALHWDDEQAAMKASAALGWEAGLSFGTALDARGAREVVLNGTGRGGAGVEGATVEVLCFHHARATEVQKATMKDLGAGHYGASLPVAKRGTWEFRLSVGRGSERFVSREI